MLPVLLAFARKYWWLALIALAVAGALGYVRTLQKQNEMLVIERNNAEASRDSIKTKYSDDSTAVMAILGFTRTELIGLREKLKLAGTTKVVTNVTAQPDSVIETHQTLSVYVDSIDGPPVDVNVYIVPDSTGAAVWSWKVRPHAIPIMIDIGCLDKHKPEVLVKTPSWVTLAALETSTHPAVCGKSEKTPREPFIEIQAGAFYDPLDERFLGQLEVETRPIWKGFGMSAQTESPFESFQVGIQRSWGLF